MISVIERVKKEKSELLFKIKKFIEVLEHPLNKGEK